MTGHEGDVLRDWQALPPRIRQAIDGLPEEALDLRGGPDGLSIREAVHHLVEANLVAATIVIAALGKSGCTFDWSWLFPDVAWSRRVGYDKTPPGPALDALAALTTHLAGVIAVGGDRLDREVRLLDAPGAETCTRTVREVLRTEVEHAAEHLAAVAETRAAHRC
jgi:hypothetical protein